MSFGSTQEEELPDENMVIAKQVKRKTATLAGLSAELQVQKQQIAQLNTELSSLKNLYNTVINMYQTLQNQRAVELNARLGGGPTSPPPEG